MERNEKLTLILQKNMMEITNINDSLDTESERRDGLELKLLQLQNILETTENELYKVKFACHQVFKEEKIAQNEIHKLSTDKLSIENHILDKIQEHVTHDKAARHLNKTVLEIRKQTRIKESLLISTENKLSRENFNKEKLKSINTKNFLLVEELDKDVIMQQKATDIIENELKHGNQLIKRKEGLIQSFNRKLEVLTSNVGSDDKSPYELKIITLKKCIEDIVENCKKLQQTWLRKQSNIVIMTQQRNDQLYEIDILRKQILIMQQKNLKYEFNTEEQIKQEEKTNKSVKHLLQTILDLNTKLFERRGHKESLDKNNYLYQNDYTSSLKDAERESAKLERDVKDVEKGKFELNHKLLDLKREYLAWERKVQMVSDSKLRVEKEKTKDGEIGAMKSEIHRMKVRYSQLHKTQEKLIQDLEHCVSRRDAILVGMEVREKKCAEGTELTRYKFQKKIENIKNNIKQNNKETKGIEMQMSRLNIHRDHIMKSVSDKEEQFLTLESLISETEKKLEDGLLNKQKNLELLLLQQHKAKMFEDVKKGHHKMLFRNETALEEENTNVKTISGQLLTVLHELISDFPAIYIKLNRILNYLCC